MSMITDACFLTSRAWKREPVTVTVSMFADELAWSACAAGLNPSHSAVAAVVPSSHA